MAWGAFQRYTWSWWLGIGAYAALLANTVITLVVTPYADLLARMHFPQPEMEALAGMPLAGWHLALFAGLPLAGTLILWVYSLRYFKLVDRKD